MNTQEKICQRAGLAARLMAVASPLRKNAALEEAARLLEKQSEEWRAAQFSDVTAASKEGRAATITTQQEVGATVDALYDVALAAEPIGASDGGVRTQDGLRVQTVKAPLGAVALLCGSRPLWVMHAIALAIKAGNAVVVGMDKQFSGAMQLGVDIWRRSLQKAGLPADVVQTAEEIDELFVDGAPLKKLFVDDTFAAPLPPTRLPLTKVERPRVTAYADGTVAADRAVEWALDWANETAGAMLLVAQSQAQDLLPLLKEKAEAEKIALKGCEATAALIDIPVETDWFGATDCLRVRLVDSINQALALVQVCGQGHIAALLTDSCEAVRRFDVTAEAAVVAVNSTASLVLPRLCDGACLGMGFGADNGPVGVGAFTVNKQTISD